MATKIKRHPRERPDKDRIRDDFKNGRRVTFGFGMSSCPGCGTVEARHECFPYPLAIVWFTFKDNNTAIEILNSFVFERYRRCGLRTKLNKVLFESYPMIKKIVTNAATETGAKWMKAAGYRRNSCKGWEVSR